MEHPTETESRLGPERAFIVQLCSDTGVEPERISGRIEHLMSGDSTRFASVETILAFMAKHTGAGDSRQPGGPASPPAPHRGTL